MARLLILLACARGAAGVMDALDIKAVCEVPTDGGPRKIYLDMDAEALETLAGPPGPDNAMSLPIETTDCEPFKSAYINFWPGGHPAWDGKGDGYGINHFDIHFYTITDNARTALMGSCVQPPGAGNCDASAPENDPFYVLPDPDYITGFVEGDTFGGHAVPGHGLHLLPAEDVADGGPANCKSTGPNGNWVDCQNQQLSLLGVPGFPGLQRSRRPGARSRARVGARRSSGRPTPARGPAAVPALTCVEIKFRARAIDATMSA